jgi:hypothetical protein
MHLRYLVVLVSSLEGVVGEGTIHLSTSPLHLLHNIQTAMHNKLIHMPRLLREPRNAITTLLRSPELIFKERVILCANNGKVIGHRGTFVVAKVAFDEGVGDGRLSEASADWLRKTSLA